MMDLCVLQRALPKTLRGKATQKLVDTINKTFKDQESADEYRDNVLGYLSVLNTGRYKIESYLDAVRYVGFSLRGDTNIQAYAKTFPARYAKHMASGISQKDMASYVTSYNNNKLVNIIRDQSAIPIHIINMDKRQEAINKLADLMHNAKSEKVQSDSATSLLTHLKVPETAKIEIDITHKEDPMMAELLETTRLLARRQQELVVEHGVGAEAIAVSKIISVGEEEE